MIDFDAIQSALILVGLLVFGEFIAGKLKAAVPGILVSGVCYLALIWSGLVPSTLVDNTGFMSIYQISIYFILINMGASIRPRELLSHWPVVVLSALTLALLYASVLLIMGKVFNLNTALAGLPGGVGVNIVVQETARALGHEDLAVLATLLFTLQGLVSCPVVSILIRREVKRLHEHPEEMKPGSASGGKLASLDAPPEDATGSFYVSFLKLLAASWIASRLAMLVPIPYPVLAFLIGMMLQQTGLIHRDEFARTRGNGLMTLIMMLVVMNGFAGATPSIIKEYLTAVVLILAADIILIALWACIIGRFLGFSPEFATALALNLMVGFPLNLILSQDIIRYNVPDPDEQGLMMSLIARKMVIAGLTSTTCLSIIFASFLMQLMK